MKPGATTRSAASITAAAPSVTRPISAILPLVMATSARRAGAPVPSTSMPFLITRSYAMESSYREIARARLTFSHHGVPQHADARDLYLHHVTVFHLLGGAVRAHPDHVARVEREVLAHAADELAHPEDR